SDDFPNVRAAATDHSPQREATESDGNARARRPAPPSTAFGTMGNGMSTGILQRDDQGDKSFLSRRHVQGAGSTAMASTSTRKSGWESRRTSTVVLVGSAAPKYSMRTSTWWKNASISVVNVWVRTRSAKVAPAAASAIFRFSPTC